MRKLIKIALVALGIRALLRWWKRRQAGSQVATEPTAGAPDPASQLRQKLAESRADDVASAEPEAPPEASVEERRAAVHTQARETVDEMTPADEA